MVLSPNEPETGGPGQPSQVEISKLSKNRILYYALGIAVVITVAVLFLNR